MIIDTSLKLADEQAITASAASENVLDLGAPEPWGLRASHANKIPIETHIKADFADAGSDGTLTIAVQSAKAAVDGTPDFAGSTITHYVSDAIPVAALKVATDINKRIRLAVPQDTQRFLRLYFTVANGPFTAGKISAAVAAAVSVNPVAV